MTTKAPARYIVIHHGGEWKINLDNRYFGPFATQEAAVAMATDTARQAVEAGHPASVLLMEGERFTPLWTSTEQDPR
ncbi:DUF2188 domain-containing protein [Sphingobium aquiterrae]|uniref:DUF2188 domain-containing protein n=1 Tax=Sphingobium aquiterrae TaxID=2038656 RepID=UPI00301A0DBB